MSGFPKLLLSHHQTLAYWKRLGGRFVADVEALLLPARRVQCSNTRYRVDIRRERRLLSIARVVSVCKGLPESGPAMGSNCKSRDYQRSRSGRILLPCGIGSPSTQYLPRCLLLRTKGHHQKLGSAKFQTTLPLQEQRYQMSVSQGFSARRALLGFPFRCDRRSSLTRRLFQSPASQCKHPETYSADRRPYRPSPDRDRIAVEP